MTPVMTERVCAAYALSHACPGFWDSLSELERLVVPYMFDLWARPDQILPAHDWRSCGFIGGRGLGKTRALACTINTEIEAGRIQSLGLMAPTGDRVDEVQIQALIDTAPPWFKPERHNGTIVWPTGVAAEVHSAEVRDGTRSSNFDFSWLTELVAWPRETRVDAFNNITTATRVGRSQFVWDTTSKGKNELILALEESHRFDPRANVIRRGETFDNPMLSRKYLRDECRKYKGRRYEEELRGKVFSSAAGALWDQAVLDKLRLSIRPEGATLTIVALDPALSPASDADETGIIVGDRGRDGHSYIHADESGHHTPGAWAKIAIDWCVKGAAGVVIERNHLGDTAAHTIISEARARSMTTEILPHAKPFPIRQPGHVFIREVTAASSKGTRASGPATETGNGRVHLIGHLDELEYQLTTFVPGEGGKSPNRFDAHAYCVTELAGLEHDHPGRDPAAEAAAAEKAQKELTESLRRSGARSRIGL